MSTYVSDFLALVQAWPMEFVLAVPVFMMTLRILAFVRDTVLAMAKS